MKIICCVLVILILSLSMAKKMDLKEELSNSMEVMEFSTESYAKLDKKQDAFGIAGNGGFWLADNALRGSKTYYDGTPNLNSISINCNVMSSMPQACVSHAKCGWCGDKNKCISGTFNGPLSPCLKQTFLFNAPSKDWNPLRAGTINIDTKGALLLTAHPDVSRVLTNNPYN